MDDVGGAEPHVDGDVPVISMSRLVITKLGCTRWVRSSEHYVLFTFSPRIQGQWN